MGKLERELPPELVADATLDLLREFSRYSGRDGFLNATRRAADLLWRIASNDTAVPPAPMPLLESSSTPLPAAAAGAAA